MGEEMRICMFCYECGAKLEEGACFCQECGTKIVQENIWDDTNGIEKSDFENYVDGYIQQNTSFSSAKELLNSKVSLKFVKISFLIPAVIMTILYIGVALKRGNFDAATIGNFLIATIIVSGLIGYVIAYIWGLFISAKYTDEMTGHFEGAVNPEDLIEFLNASFKYLTPYFHDWGYLAETPLSVSTSIQKGIRDLAKEKLKQICVCTEYGENGWRICVIHIGLQSPDSEQMKYYFSVSNKFEGFLFKSHDMGFEKYKTLIKTAPIMKAAVEYYFKKYNCEK